jgi:hypothetical protein
MYRYDEPKFYRVFEVDDLTGLETATDRYLHPGECEDYLDVRNSNPKPLSRRVVVKPCHPITLPQPQFS